MTFTLLPLRTLFSRKAILPRRRPHERFRARSLACERLETRAMLAADALSDWQNQVLPADVNADGHVTAMDALRIINQLNSSGPRLLSGSASDINRTSFMAAGEAPHNYYDVNGDGRLSAVDALVVFNTLNAAQDDKVRIHLDITDADGNPITSLPTGQEFQLRGFTQDIRASSPGGRGVFSAYFDVTYDPALVTPSGAVVYSSSYPNQQTPDTEVRAVAGVLDEIGALSTGGDLGTGEVLLFTVPFTVHRAGTVTFALDPADNPDNEMLVLGEDEVVPADEVELLGDSEDLGSPPIATDDTATVAEDSQDNSIAVLDNDTVNPDGGVGPLTIISVNPGASGSVGIGAGNTTVTYTPNENFFGQDTFTYTIQDANGDTAEATVTVTVTNTNDLPDAVNDTLNVDADTQDNDLDVLINDTFAPDVGETLTISAVGMPDHNGTVTIVGGQLLRYSPAAGFVGTETFTYTISDGNGGSDTATVTVDVRSDNPIARPDEFPGIVEDSEDNTLFVLDNDELAPGVEGNLLITDFGPTDHGGTVIIAANAKELRYTPAPDFFGIETFTYHVIDGQGGEATATVTVTVTNTNDPPTANDDEFTVDQDSPAQNFMVLDNDSSAPDPEETLTITAADAVGSQGGTIEISQTDDFIRYTPAAGFTGTETFTYTISDGDLTDTATVTVTVLAPNQLPIAVDDIVPVAEDSTDNPADVLANDSDPNGDTLTITSVSNGSQGGTIAIAQDMRSLIYTPLANFAGAEAFTYTISDGRGGTATGTVFFNVTPVNDPPTAVDDDLEVLEDSADNVLDVLANDSSAPDTGETITITAVGETSGDGTVTIANDNLSLIYTPAAGFSGTETFTYTIDDGTGMTATATVTVTVNPLNNPPVAGDDTATVIEDTAANIIDVLENDTTDEGETLTISEVTQGAHGAVTIAGDGLSVTYTPTADFNGTDTFTYTISDGELTDTATVTVTVTAVNDPPPAVNDTASVAEDAPATTIDVLANDSPNPDAGETLTVTAVTPGNNGTVTIGPNGQTVVFTPKLNFNGQETFTYTVSDGTSTSTATVTVTVTAANDDPPAVNDTATVQQNSTNNTINVLVNDAPNPDANETLSITAVTQGTSGGAVEIVGTSVRYTPAFGFVGQDTFTYTVSDGNGGSKTATVTVTVQPLARGSLSGFVYVDSDGDGVKDTGEQPLVNVRIRLWGKDVNGQSVDMTTTTDGTGAYQFTDLVAGSYVIEETQPEPYLDGAESASKPGVVSGHDQFFITLANGQNITANNFGERGLRPEFIGRPNFFQP